MKIILLTFGKTSYKPLAELENDYLKKTGKYINIEMVTIKEPSGHTRLSTLEQMKAESVLFEKKLQPGDLCIVLDEKGKQMNSVEFSAFIQNRMSGSYKRIVFIIGGPYGTDRPLKEKAKSSISLSLMTFTHEMARVILLEQIYRAFNIIKKTPYHHI